MEPQQNAAFDGWAVVELFGHQKEVGYVTTQYFGGPALFRIDVPEMEEREVELKRPEYVGGSFAPAGSRVRRGAVQARTRFIGPGAIYAMNPCTEETARKVLEDMTPRPVAIVSLPDGKQLLPGELTEAEGDEDPEDED